MANRIEFKVFGDVQDLENKLQGLNKSFKQLTKVGGVGLLASGGALVALVKAADTQARAVAKVNQAIVSTGGAAKLSLEQLKKEATDLQRKTLFGDEVILQNATAQLLTFTNIAEENFLRTQKVALDVATVLDTTGDGTSRLRDVSIQLGKALNDPVKNLGALGRAGIQFSKEQEQLIKTLVETNQLAKAQDIILKEVEKQYGGQAEAAVTVYQKLGQLRGRFVDILEIVGEKLTPVLGILVKQFEKFIVYLEEHPKIATFAAGIVALTFVMSGFLLTLGLVGQGLIGTVTTLAALKGAFASIGLLFSAIASPIFLTIAGIATAVGLLFLAWKNNFLGMADFLDGLFDKLILFKNKVLEVFGKVKEVMIGTVDALKRALNTISFGKIGLGASNAEAATIPADQNTELTTGSATGQKTKDEALAEEQSFADKILAIKESLSQKINDITITDLEIQKEVNLQKQQDDLLARQKELEGYLLELQSKKDILEAHNTEVIDLEQQLNSELATIEQERTNLVLTELKKRLKLKELFQAQEVESLQSTLNQLSTLGKTAARVTQSIEIGLATIRIAAGISRAFAEYPFPASLGVAAIIAAQGAIQIATIARQSFAQGTPEIPQDQLANVHKGEMIIPQSFAESIRKGDLSLSGGTSSGGDSQIVFDFTGATFNDVTESLIRKIFGQASEMMRNNTLAFRGV